jgi:hypothetical protein
MDMEKERYINFYLPIIKHLYSIDSEHVTLNVMTFNTLTGETNFLANHIQKNFEYISPQVGSLYTEYQPLSGRVLFNDEFETVEELDILFKKIIQQVLKDSSKLSRKLELPDLAQPLSDAFF